MIFYARNNFVISNLISIKIGFIKYISLHSIRNLNTLYFICKWNFIRSTTNFLTITLKIAFWINYYAPFRGIKLILRLLFLLLFILSLRLSLFSNNLFFCIIIIISFSKPFIAWFTTLIFQATYSIITVMSKAKAFTLNIIYTTSLHILQFNRLC